MNISSGSVTANFIEFEVLGAFDSQKLNIENIQFQAGVENHQKSVDSDCSYEAFKLSSTGFGSSHGVFMH